jgi:hypothetical protein
MSEPSESILLQPFTQAPMRVRAKLLINRGLIEVRFQLDDPQNVVKKPSPEDSPSLERKNGLWQSTCFEVFISSPKAEDYYEINLSPWRGWNAYAFQSYRSPQPPKATEDLKILNLHWQNSELSASLELSSKNESWECALTTVVETRQSEKIYFASHHAGENPDFHLRKSFRLHRGHP